MRDRLFLSLTVAIALIGGYLIYWYVQSPVGAGVYPARMGGTIFANDPEPFFDLPVIWVRPHPFAELPPRFQQVALAGEQGDGPSTVGTWYPQIAWMNRRIPLWLRPRAVQGHVRVTFPEEGFTATGVRWQIEGQAAERYRTGPVEFRWVPQAKTTMNISGGMLQLGYPHDEFGKEFDETTIEGYYLWLEGYGTITGVISSLPGGDSPTTGLRFRPGHEDGGITRRFYEKEIYEPVTLPWNARSGTLYVPLPPAVSDRLRDTYFYYRPALVLEADGSQQTIVSGFSEHGFRNVGTWRYWVPYYVYTSE